MVLNWYWNLDLYLNLKESCLSAYNLEVFRKHILSACCQYRRVKLGFMEAKEFYIERKCMEGVFLHGKVCNLSFECQPNRPSNKYFKDLSNITRCLESD